MKSLWLEGENFDISPYLKHQFTENSHHWVRSISLLETAISDLKVLEMGILRFGKVDLELQDLYKTFSGHLFRSPFMKLTF